MAALPSWMDNLDDEDLVFIKKLMLSSGSLKEVPRLYGVTYPTVRLCLDRLIGRIRLAEDTESEPYIALVKRLAVDEKIDLETARLLIAEYKKTTKESMNHE